jgi:hypothetical protein
MIASEHKRTIQQKGEHIPSKILLLEEESKRKCKFDEICSRFCDFIVGLFFFMLKVNNISP